MMGEAYFKLAVLSNSKRERAGRNVLEKNNGQQTATRSEWEKERSGTRQNRSRALRASLRTLPM